MKGRGGKKKASSMAQQLELLNYPWNTSVEDIVSQEDPSVYHARRSSAGWQMPVESDLLSMSGGEDTMDGGDQGFITPEELMGFWGSRLDQRGIR
jgi:hypothetical protein